MTLKSRGSLRHFTQCSARTYGLPSGIADTPLMDFRTLAIRIARSENVPVLPTVVLKILKMYGADEATPKSLEQVIIHDAGFAAKVLRVASSSLYGGTPVSDVQRAISVIGLNQLRHITISLAYQEFMTTRGSVPSFDRIIFWQHCLATGVASRELMRLVNDINSDEAYIAGLTHDIGILALERFSPVQLDQSIRTAAAKAIPLADVEMRLHGFTHAQVGGILADSWKLSKQIANSVRFHDCPYEDTETPEMSLVVAAGNQIAYEMGYPSVACVPGNESLLDIVDKLELKPESIERVKRCVKTEVDMADHEFGSRRAA
jgi:HD-like signal output (HDOD) protein